MSHEAPATGSRAPCRAVPLVCLAFLVGSASAALYPILGYRELVHRSSSIVVAEPVEVPQAGRPGRFRVLEVLEGTAVRPDETITVTRLVAWSRWGKNWRPEPARIAKVLLFLKEPRKRMDARHFDMVISGVRGLTESGACLKPTQPMNPGSVYFGLAKDLKWDALLATVREDIVGVREVERLLAIEEPTPRNKALFAWIDEHRDELHTRARRGWDTLAYKVFHRVMDSCRPDDCWRAVKLWAELRPNDHLLSARAPAFGSPEGRRLLLGIARDRERTARERATALQHLGATDSLWPRPDPEYPRASRLDRKEQAALLDELVPLLTAPETELHLPAVEAIHRISDPSDETMKTRRALAALLPLYETVEPGRFRNALVLAIRTIGGVERWEALTGNPLGVLPEFWLRENTGTEIRLGFDVEHTAAVIYDRPTLILERLGQTSRDVVEHRSMPVPDARMPRPWREGYRSRDSFLRFCIPTKPLTPGRWRLRVTGTIGHDRRPWRSEPLEIVVARKG